MKRYAELTGNRESHRIKSRWDNRIDIPGLKDPGGALAFTANNTDAFQTAWAALVTAAETAKASNKATWFEIVVPGLTKSFQFAGIPSDRGLSAIDVDSVLEVDAYVAPNQIDGWDTKSS